MTRSRTAPVLLLPALLVTSTLAAGCAIDQGFGKSGTETATPDIVVDPGQLVFERVAFGTTETKSVTVTNYGDAALNIEGIRLEQAGAFTVLAEAPVTLPGGESTTFDVVYSPVTDEDSGRLYVDSNDPDTPNATVELLGTSGSPRLVIDPPNHDFGELPLYCADAVVHTLRNEGTADLEISGIYETGEGFGLGDAYTFPIELEPGEELEVPVTFEALLAAELNGSLWVESNDPGGTRQAPQTGAGDGDGVCIAVPPGGEEGVDMEFAAEYKMADIAFVLDTTGSMSGLANQVASSFADLATLVADRIPDVTFGAATYEDYHDPAQSMGAAGDLPWRLRQQQTSDLSLVSTALNSVRVNNGADLPESSFEALYQAATGRGFDQNCNNALDTSTDVPPFQATVGDAFGGVVAGTYDPNVEGTGELGGMGFREDVLPIVIYATDAELRDPDRGYDVPGDGTCNPGAAGSNAATSALNALGAKTIGIVVSSGGGGPTRQMEDVAEATGSWGDFDGDGDEELAVLQWSSGSLSESVADAIESIVDAAIFDEVWLEVEGDDHGLVESIDPERYTDVPSGEEMPFHIEFTGAVPSEANDRTYAIIFVLKGRVGDVELVLDRFTVHVLVPGA